MRIAFFGSTEFSVIVLQGLLVNRHEILAAITRPDRPAGRGRGDRETELKRFAEENGTLTLQPESLRDAKFVKAMRELKCDIGVVAAYGGLIPIDLLEIPKLDF